MRISAIVLMSSLALAGCDNAALFAPMQPTRESMAAARRPLSDTEKEAISAAVMRKLGEQRAETSSGCRSSSGPTAASPITAAW